MKIPMAILRRFILTWLFVLGFGGTAHAQPSGFSRATADGGKLDADSLLHRSVKDRAVKRKGRLKDLGSVEVAPGPRGARQPISALAKQLFAEHDQIERRVRGNRGIVGDVGSIDEVYELDDRIIVLRTTRAVISDPKEVARVAPELVSRRGTAKPDPFTSLDAESRASLEAFRKEALGYPAGHPLLQAAKKGEEALYLAIAEGFGEIEIIDTIVMPKNPVPVTNGRVAVSRRTDGTFTLPPSGKPPKANLEHQQAEITLPVLPGLESHVSTSGQHSTTAKLLNGFTEGHLWEWERRWNFPTGYLEVGASAAYGVGIRIPILVETTMTPRNINRWGPHAGPGDKAEVTIKARTLNAGTDHYSAAGLQSSQLFDGHEFVLQLGFGYKLKFRALGKNLVNIDKWKDLINRNRHFTPPQSDSWSTLMTLWIPASVTHSQITIPAVISGSVQAGAKLDATGRVSMKVEGRMNGQSIPVSQGGGTPTTFRTLNFPTADTSRKVFIHVPPAPNAGTVRPFGFEIRDVRYEAEMSVVPGVKVTLESLVPGFKGHSWSTEVWLNLLRLELGGAGFATHEGTHATHGHEIGSARYTVEKTVLTRPD